MKRLIPWLLLVFTAVTAGAEEASRLPLLLHGHSASDTFHVEVAKTKQEMARGLMFRDSLAQDGGMLFVYSPPQSAYMWMHNTPIPLDMLFIDDRHRIVHIVDQAEPFDDTPVGTPLKVVSVVELPGGTVDRLGLSVGDAVDYTLAGETLGHPK